MPGIDVFSPRYLPFDWNALMGFIFGYSLDISPSSIHTKRRIWQESITTLLLTDSECHIPAKQSMSFAQARDSEYPPFLLDFAGTPGERHVENLKVGLLLITSQLLSSFRNRSYGKLALEYIMEQSL